MKRTSVAGCVLLSALVLAACGSESGGGVTTVVQQVPPPRTVTVQQSSAPQAEPVPEAPEEQKRASDSSSGGGDKVPDIVGERLDVAEDELDDLGIPYEEIGGGTFGIVNPSNWVVCESKPKPGQRTDGTVKLIVDRPGNC